ncbi:MAG: hypothetical protein WBK76_02770 [Candidatus Saccharimonadales bacterium]
MADRRQIKQGLSWLQRVRTWQLILLLIIVAVIAATFLRLNNIGMIERRTAVFSADKQGDQETIRARLFDLQRYSAGHMNADSGIIYLEAQYQRDTQAAIDAASARDGGNNINVLADQACKKQFGGYSQAYVQCFAAELAKYPSGSNAPDKAALPSPNLYRHAFASPVWSPDFAGFSLLICGLIVVLIATRLLGLLLLRVLLRRHYSSI